MNGRYLLDTNIIIALFANEIKIVNRLKEIENVFIPSIALVSYIMGHPNQKTLKKIFSE